MLGLLVAALLLTINKPLGALGGYVDFVQWIETRAGGPSWRALFVVGTLIGYGARLGGGCTSGHGMCGTAMGLPASLVATMTFMGTAIVAAHLLTLIVRSGS